MPILNLKLKSFLVHNERRKGATDLHSLAHYIGKMLAKSVDVLEERGLFFEATTAQNLSDEFIAFFADRAPEAQFASLWSDLQDWAEQYVTVNGRSETICVSPVLDNRYAF